MEHLHKRNKQSLPGVSSVIIQMTYTDQPNHSNYHKTNTTINEKVTGLWSKNILFEAFDGKKNLAAPVTTFKFQSYSIQV